MDAGDGMLTAALIAKKRDGLALSSDEIRFLIEGFVAGAVADYQMSAFAMAVYLRGMSAEETASLTMAMLDSGERLARIPDGPPRVDKHSTGGLGDNVSLILAPLLACHQVQVPMISGRGLGLSGGTLDKLEAIPGFRVHLEPAERQRQLQEVGCFIIGASETIAPADQKLYALRDVTATVESAALITASILSKKLAADLDALVMDVKVGSAAFMKTHSDARELADSIVTTGKLAGLPTCALLSDMDQPLCRAIGNAIEVNEAMRLLGGSESAEVLQLTLELGAEVLQLCGRYSSLQEASAALRQSVQDGSARERFDRLVVSQGGTLRGFLPLASEQVLMAPCDGFVASIDCETLGRCVVEMGGGRRVTTDQIDPSVGIMLNCRIGDPIGRGQPLLQIHAQSDHEHWRSELQQVVSLSQEPVPVRSLVLARIGGAESKP